MWSSALLGAALSAAPSEVEFNCPWCNTRLAIPRSDFLNERAVLCPRCNNPVDLDIQRRLARASPAEAPRAMAPEPPAPGRRQVTTAPKKQPPRPREAPPPAAPPAALPEREPRRTAPPEALDWTKPVDVDVSMGLKGPLRAKGSEYEASPKGPAASVPTPRPDYESKRRCPSCGFENARVPAGFSFGTEEKCSWCNKPLPAT